MQKYMIFDLDGTLINSMPLWKNIGKDYLNRYGFLPPTDLDDRVKKQTLFETASYFKELFDIPKTINEMVTEIIAMVAGQYANTVPLKPFAKQYLQKEKQNGTKMCVLTASEPDYILAAMFGGVLSGISMGMILWANATTGGTEMVAILIQHKLKHYSVAQIMQVLDGIIVLLGMYVFGLRPSMYAIVAIFISSKVTDTILEGMKFSKAAYIITEKYEEIAKIIMQELDRGVTGMEARGMYSGEKKCMLYCVVSKKQIVLLKEIIHQLDKNAFVIVGDVREVLGEGFLKYKGH